ncbi:MAG: hypothetical protein NC084_08715 [Bacteroides sp.]|nr:hypothetical protein [Eubacterium sp.]MCM1418226.1 hypothetical protein [Roseburia sp.]MCM1462777.1 hypothetical protein [Bacteroides sp.]
MGANSKTIRDCILENLGMEVLSSLANGGNENAQYYLAIILAMEYGENQKSNKLLKLAAENKMPLAQYCIGLRELLSNASLSNSSLTLLSEAIDNGYDYHSMINDMIVSMNSMINVVRTALQSEKRSRQYVLVKITRKCHADDFEKMGEVFMSPMEKYRKNGAPGIGDMYEGVGNTGINQMWSDLFQGEAVSDFVECGVFDEYMAHESLFCLYALEKNKKGEIIKPDIRMKQFGDTAVVILDAHQFIDRLITAINKQYGDIWIGYDRVKYEVDFAITSNYTEFSKTVPYSWQNEFRIVVDIANGKFSKEVWDGMTEGEKKILVEKEDRTPYEDLKLHTSGMTDFAKLMALNAGYTSSLYEDSGSEKIYLGDLTSICKSFPIDDFLNLTPEFLTAIENAEWGSLNDVPEHIRPFAWRPIIKT